MSRVLIAVFVCVLAVPGIARAQRGGWVDVNLGVAASTGEAQTFTYEGRMFSEPYALAAAYPKPSRGAEFDFGGGFMFTPLVGVGVTFTGQAHEDAAGLAITVPHPFFFNAAATDAGATNGLLSRAEGGTHLQVMLAPVHSDRFRFRVFGGPSIFRLKADMAQDITWNQAATIFSRANSVSITSADLVEAEGTGWGFHAGADASYFFTRIVGVGGLVRFSHGSVTLDPEAMSEVAQDVKVGGIHAGGGLRLRF